jgi:hypothetical protein
MKQIKYISICLIIIFALFSKPPNIYATELIEPTATKTTHFPVSVEETEESG